MGLKYLNWTETYLSWEEYKLKNSDWNKTPSSRMAAQFARLEIQEKGKYTAHYFRGSINKRVHEAVSRFIQKIERAHITVENSNLVFKAGLAT